MKKIYVLGGGTVFHLRPHLALSAPAYGATATTLARKLERELVDGKHSLQYQVHLGLTRMAIGAAQERRGFPTTHMIGETNYDVAQFLEKIATDPDTKMIFMSAALCDFEGSVGTVEGYEKEGAQWSTYATHFNGTASGKKEPRLKSDTAGLYVQLKAANKLIGEIRKHRKDIFLVGFKTTAGASEEEQYQAGLTLLKKNSCNLVLANDVQTGLNMIVCPELAAYSVSTDRSKVLDDLAEMALLRSSNKFTRTTIVDGELMPWDFYEVPVALQEVVNWCVENGAYKPFNNVTVGHFGYKAAPNVLYSSRRKQNFNIKSNRDLVRVEFDVDSELDCIVHFHCQKKPHSLVPVRSQREFECGSHQCGRNTADGLQRINDHLAAVMLDKHGPNIVFSREANPEMVIDFIRSNFDLSKSTK